MTYSPPTRLARAGRDLGIAETLYVPGFLAPGQADALLEEVIDAADWRQERFPLFGRLAVAPRLTAWYGEPGATYRYGGVDRPAGTWLPPIRNLAAQVAKAVGWRFNYVLVNRYRDGNDMLGWHADDEADLGRCPCWRRSASVPNACSECGRGAAVQVRRTFSATARFS